MSNLRFYEFYRRHLPHFQPRGFSLLINFRLANSLPAEMAERLSAETAEIERVLIKVTDLSERYRLKESEERRRF